MAVDCLVPNEAFRLKGTNEALNLRFGPVLQERHIHEESRLLLQLPRFNTLQYFLEVPSVQNGKVAVSCGFDGGSSGCVVQEGQLAESLTLIEVEHIDKPFEFLVLLQMTKLMEFILTKSQMIL